MSAPDAPAEVAARVVESFGRRAIVETEQGERVPAELFGKRLTVVCGDQVMVRQAHASGSDSMPRIISVIQRRTLFQRTDSRGRTEPLAANLSLLAAFIAPEPAPDPYMLDRYLAGAAYSSVRGAVIVNKSDLPATGAPEFVALIDEYRRAGYPVFTLSALHADAVEQMRELLRGNITMLAGQSGVGKSTFTNALVPASERVTRALSDLSREGRHTTVSTALFRIPGGGELIDSPGVRDYAPALVDDSFVQTGWPEIRALAGQCKFNNCLHLREPGCVVIQAVANLSISPRRYDSYKRLLNIMRGLAPDYERRR
ncbi:MAG TPA: ribosome small subunit-dependent GTPase A [Steroidobacteraceae bacterium]|jgi:ribosome biogenesis GTPase